MEYRDGNWVCSEEENRQWKERQEYIHSLAQKNILTLDEYSDLCIEYFMGYWHNIFNSVDCNLDEINIPNENMRLFYITDNQLKLVYKSMVNDIQQARELAS